MSLSCDKTVAETPGSSGRLTADGGWTSCSAQGGWLRECDDTL
jgi:hypothetical protein